MEQTYRSVSVVTPSIFGDYLDKVLEQLWKTSLPFQHIFILDNPSKKCLEIVKQYYFKALQSNNRRVTIIKSPFYLGAAGAYNLGICLSKADYICLLADDLLVSDNFLEYCVGTLIRHPEFGWVSAYHNHHWNIPFHTNGSVIAREVIEKVGLLDMRFNPLGREFEDLYMRVVEAGYTPHSVSGLFIWRSETFSTTLRKVHGKSFNIVHDSQNLLFLKRHGRLFMIPVPYYKGEKTIPEGYKIVLPP